MRFPRIHDYVESSPEPQICVSGFKWTSPGFIIQKQGYAA